MGEKVEVGENEGEFFVTTQQKLVTTCVGGLFTFIT